MLHAHFPFTHTPFCEQSCGHTVTLQSSPIKPDSHEHVVSRQRPLGNEQSFGQPTAARELELVVMSVRTGVGCGDGGREGVETVGVVVVVVVVLVEEEEEEEEEGELVGVTVVAGS